MNETTVIPWVPLASVAAVFLAYTVVRRAVPALIRVALGELDYRAGNASDWGEWRR